MMQSSYLYGDDFDNSKLKEMLYEDALKYKIESARLLLRELCTVAYAENNGRINAICEAIKFNKRLIEEANGKEHE